MICFEVRDVFVNKEYAAWRAWRGVVGGVEGGVEEGVVDECVHWVGEGDEYGDGLWELARAWGYALGWSRLRQTWAVSWALGGVRV